jgi:hypothetical protein
MGKFLDVTYVTGIFIDRFSWFCSGAPSPPKDTDHFWEMKSYRKWLFVSNLLTSNRKISPQKSFIVAQ